MGPAGSRSSQCNPLPSSTQGNHSSIEAQPAAARPQLPLFLPADLACSGCSTMGVESAQPTPAAAAEQAQDVIDAARYDELEDVVAHLSAEVSLDSADFARPNGLVYSPVQVLLVLRSLFRCFCYAMSVWCVKRDGCVLAYTGCVAYEVLNNTNTIPG